MSLSTALLYAASLSIAAATARFELQTMALQAQLRLDEDRLAAIFFEARDLQERLAEELAPAGQRQR